jgi:acyl-CoA thioesterase YciA|tara:strand:- start:56 stop:436 length:381 start_codon:yes stop_codon:yes gene_type:complete
MKLIATHVVKAFNLGVHGNLFGGTILSWIDEAGAVYASEEASSTNMVTVAMDKVEFIKPVKLGRMVKIYGNTIAVGTTSITVQIEARVYNPYNSKESLVCKTKVIFVRIDADGSPIPITKINKNDG